MTEPLISDAIAEAQRVATSDACKLARERSGNRNWHHAFEWQIQDEVLLRRGFIRTPRGLLAVRR